jgi:hypothetical protein
MNFLPAVAERDAAGFAVQVPGAGRLALPADCATPLASVHSLGVRPEHWQMTRVTAPTACRPASSASNGSAT